MLPLSTSSLLARARLAFPLVLAPAPPPLAYLAAPFERIAAGAQLDAERRTRELEFVAEVPLEVAPVGVRHAVDRVAVDDDARRVEAALVRIAQLRPDRTALRRRLALDRRDQRARQLRRRQLRHGGG